MPDAVACKHLSLATALAYHAMLDKIAEEQRASDGNVYRVLTW